MAVRAARSISLRLREKFRNWQPNTSGGQAGRMCTSLAPQSNSRWIVSLSCVPRTMESSQNSSRLPWIRSWIGISFIRATRSRMAWSCGMKLRGQVGVYFTNGRLVRDAACVGVADGVAGAAVGDAGDAVDLDVVAAGQGRAAAVAGRLDVDALVAGGRVAVVHPQERADLHLLARRGHRARRRRRVMRTISPGPKLPLELVAQVGQGAGLQRGGPARRPSGRG